MPTPNKPSATPRATTPYNSAVAQCPNKFDIDIKLVSHSDDTILTPLRIPSYDELASGSTKNQDHVKFKVRVTDNQVNKMEVEITTGQGTNKSRVFFQDLAKLRMVGVHDWTWDGYNNAGILDTKILCDQTLALELRAELQGIHKSKTIMFWNNHVKENWVDVVIDKNAKTVNVELRTNLKDGGEDGVGELPPEAVRTDPKFKNLPQHQKAVRLRSYKQLEALALSGISEYWSRNSNGRSIKTVAGIYLVTVNAISTQDKAMDDMNLRYNTNRAYKYSSNPNRVRSPLSLVFNIAPEQVVYQVGFIDYGNILEADWRYFKEYDADKKFRETAAHEVGHEILCAYGGDNYSFTHKGSSNLAQQGGISYPPTGELDIMKYYLHRQPKDFYERVVADESDVKSLIWFARIQFNG